MHRNFNFVRMAGKFLVKTQYVSAKPVSSLYRRDQGLRTFFAILCHILGTKFFLVFPNFQQVLLFRAFSSDSDGRGGRHFDGRGGGYRVLDTKEARAKLHCYLLAILLLPQRCKQSVISWMKKQACCSNRAWCKCACSNSSSSKNAEASVPRSARCLQNSHLGGGL